MDTTQIVPVRMPIVLKQRLDRAAGIAGRSFNRFITDLLATNIGPYERQYAGNMPLGDVDSAAMKGTFIDVIEDAPVKLVFEGTQGGDGSGRQAPIMKLAIHV